MKQLTNSNIKNTTYLTPIIFTITITHAISCINHCSIRQPFIYKLNSLYLCIFIFLFYFIINYISVFIFNSFFFFFTCFSYSHYKIEFRESFFFICTFTTCLLIVPNTNKLTNNCNQFS